MCSTVCIQKNNRDFLNPIKFQLTQRLQDTQQPVLVPGQRLPDIDRFMVLNATLATNILSVSTLLSFNVFVAIMQLFLL